MRKEDVFMLVLKQVLKDIKKNQLYKKEDLKAIYNDLKQAYFYLNFKNFNFFSYGNLKLNKNIMIFNLPSTITCPCSCVKCYAKKAERIYKNTRYMRLKNYFIMLLCNYDYNFKKIVKDIFIQKINNHALLYKKPILRIHESGDFFNKKYLNFWLSIKKDKFLNKKIKFYTYTKILDFKTILNIKEKYNFNIVTSYINIKGKKYINYGNFDYIEKLKILLKANNMPFFVCDYGVKNTLHCGINCMACCKYSIVLFYIQ